MPTTNTEFSLGLPRDKLWEMLNDLKSLGKCIPGCEAVDVLGPDDSRWKMKLSVGIVSRRIEARAHVAERVKPESLVINLQSIDGDLTGVWKLQLSEENPTSTKVKLTAEITARGAFEWAVNQIIKSQMSKMVSQFVDCISKSIEG
ncbi:MAG: SRPBCC domain-containing protein [Thaumarchaeota archaeon]|nr:SRPBCC domain-containing protein [Nitrososphaerota archaeon]